MLSCSICAPRRLCRTGIVIDARKHEDIKCPQRHQKFEGCGGCAARSPLPWMRDARSLTGAGGDVSRKRQGSETSRGERLKGRPQFHPQTSGTKFGTKFGDTHDKVPGTPTIPSSKSSRRIGPNAAPPARRRSTDFPKPKRKSPGDARASPRRWRCPQAAAAWAMRGPSSRARRTMRSSRSSSSSAIAKCGVKRSEFSPPWITPMPRSRIHSSVEPAP